MHIIPTPQVPPHLQVYGTRAVYRTCHSQFDRAFFGATAYFVLSRLEGIRSFELFSFPARHAPSGWSGIPWSCAVAQELQPPFLAPLSPPLPHLIRLTNDSLFHSPHPLIRISPFFWLYPLRKTLAVQGGAISPSRPLLPPSFPFPRRRFECNRSFHVDLRIWRSFFFAKNLTPT